MPEQIRPKIDLYIDEAALLLKEVWGQSDEEVYRFIDWAYDHLLGNMSSPFLLHDHPFYFSGRYLGVTADDPRQKEADLKFRELADREDYQKKFQDGWRVKFGLFGKETDAYGSLNFPVELKPHHL